MDTSPLSIKLLLHCLLCTIMFKYVICNGNIHCNEKDVNTLLLFKQGLTDPSGLLSSWFPKSDCCQWTGVQCDNITGRVTQLHLPCHINQPKFLDFEDEVDKSNCLTGELNLSLLELEFLSYLDLSNNDFKSIQHKMGGQKCDDLSRGNLPYLCRNSTNLRYLNLSHNYDLLVDNLHWISRLSSLQDLDLGGVRLHKEIDWLQLVVMLSSLLKLHLQSCQLENIYPSSHYANFTSLQLLNLADNNFVYDELPSWLFNLSSDIYYIDLSENQIHGQLPKTLSDLRRLKFLYLNSNGLKGPIPNWLGQFEQLQVLDLSYNYFSGRIPASLGNLSSLIELTLKNNELDGDLPGHLGQLFNLETLDISENSLTGIVSERNLLSLTNLKNIFISSPALIFDFDPQWVDPFQLQQIHLGYVREKLPAWLFTQSSLKYLSIVDSTASFEPLDKFWNFATKVEYINLFNNTINGDISNVFLRSKFVWLISNNLSGGVPRISPEVEILELSANTLSGSLSPLLCDNHMTDKSNLVFLAISDNHLSGELTDCWNNWKSLVLINLGNNNLTGKIPHSMGSLSDLRFLYLENNKLFGEVPFSLKNCKNLCILTLAHNNLSRVIPSWLGQSVKVLLLRSNQFSGNIPAQICQLHSLAVMDFANNRLSGPIPNCLSNITAMLSFYTSTFGFKANFPGLSMRLELGIVMSVKGTEMQHFTAMNMIDLSSNNLSGSVPLEMYMLTGLQSLNLSHNQLMGTIPHEIGNLKQLESIDFSRNHFSGEIPKSMSALHYLEVLNLSFNNLVGKIPSGTQLGFTNLSYIDNPDLCGAPLSKICRHDEKFYNTKPMREEHDEVHSWFYMGLGIGFAVGFWGVFGTVLFNRRCRHAYFRFLNQTCDFVIRKNHSIYSNKISRN